MAVQVAACGTNAQASQGGVGSQVGIRTVLLVLSMGGGCELPRPPQGPDYCSRPCKPGPWGPVPCRARDKWQVGTCSGDKHQQSAVRLGERGCWEAGPSLPHPAEAWDCYLHGREEERFGVR